MDKEFVKFYKIINLFDFWELTINVLYFWDLTVNMLIKL